MPELILKDSGLSVYVSSEGLSDAIASGLYEAPIGDEQVNVELQPGVVGTTTLRDMSAIEARGGSPERETSFRARERDVRLEREHGGAIDTVIAGAENALNEATLGGFGVVGELLGGDEYTERRLERSEANPYAAGIGKGVGILAPAIASGSSSVAARALAANPLGAVTRIGSRIAKSGEGIGAVSRAGRIAAGGAFEGLAGGAGQAVQQLTDMAEPLSVETAVSSLSSNMLFGGLAGAGAGLVGKGIEHGFSRAKAALDEASTRIGARADMADELSKLDAKGLREAERAEISALREAEKAEIEALKAAERSELDAIEAVRVTERGKLADDIAALRRDIKDQKHFLTTSEVKLPAVEGKASAAELGRVAAKANKQLDHLLDNPTGFAQNPGKALDALQRQEGAMVKLLDRAEDLKEVFKADTTGARMKALDSIAPALERNRALQGRISELVKPPASAKLTEIAEARTAIQSGSLKTSPRLEEIAAARDAITDGGGKGFPRQMLQGAVFGNVTSLAAPLGPLAPMLGAKVSNLVADVVFGKLGAAQAQVTARAAKAVGAFLDVTKRATPAAPVLGSKVLASVRFAPQPKQSRKTKSQAQSGNPPTLAESFHARAAELRSLVESGPNGRAVLRGDVRERLADQLRPMDIVSPLAADGMEAAAARRIEFLADKLPRRPEIGVHLGPDRWQPSDMEMRAFARYVAAAEDPIGVIERVTAGTVTPEDAETMREVYPALYADIQRQIIEGLPQLKQTLPYQKRLAYSIFSGVPVDAAMEPRILNALQASFADEPGTSGGHEAPKPLPAFGSVRNMEATPSEKRYGNF